MTAETVNTGIEKEDAKSVAEGLAGVLADEYTLYLKTHNYHWNVTGPLFGSLHALFEVQYQELAVSIDVIAERIRALGQFVPATFGQYAKMTEVKESEEIPPADKMISELVDARETCAVEARKVLEEAEKVGDQASADLLTTRVAEHEKQAWMLRAHLDK